MENLVKGIPNNLTHYQETTDFTDALKRSAKQNIPRGRMLKYKPFWNEDLKKQKETREKAEETEGEIGQRREDVVRRRKECAVMKRKINIAKNQSWNDFLQNMDYRTDGPNAYRLMDTLKIKKIQS
ncbi:hypothetical protein NPIL_436741 [Nephila pilipes]|uniref:Uncharacterized protein n=1 Tax=Nephila pilipes TaxID=299642 RepID=A0A8X6TGG3_NEPPI|nr:hypothetical protein NPIL_436741 [Nephila pilipes]